MPRKERRPPRAARIDALLEAGDHRAARAEAQAVLADAAASAEERAEAVRALASLAPERGALVAGALGLGAAVALLAFLLARN